MRNDVIDTIGSTLKAAVGAPAGKLFEKTLAEDASAVAGFARNVKDHAVDGIADLGNAAIAAGGNAKEAVGKYAASAANSFTEAVETHKSAGADALASVARSARDAAGGFEKQSPQVARMVRSAADSVERVSTDIRDHTVGDLVGAISDFAHRQPKVFFGFGVLTGLVLSRFIRSSSET